MRTLSLNFPKISLPKIPLLGLVGSSLPLALPGAFSKALSNIPFQFSLASLYGPLLNTYGAPLMALSLSFATVTSTAPSAPVTRLAKSQMPLTHDLSMTTSTPRSLTTVVREATEIVKNVAFSPSFKSITSPELESVLERASVEIPSFSGVGPIAKPQDLEAIIAIPQGQSVLNPQTLSHQSAMASSLSKVRALSFARTATMSSPVLGESLSQSHLMQSLRADIERWSNSLDQMDALFEEAVSKVESILEASPYTFIFRGKEETAFFEAADGMAHKFAAPWRKREIIIELVQSLSDSLSKSCIHASTHGLMKKNIISEEEGRAAIGHFENRG